MIPELPSAAEKIKVRYLPVIVSQDLSYLQGILVD